MLHFPPLPILFPLLHLTNISYKIVEHYMLQLKAFALDKRGRCLFSFTKSNIIFKFSLVVSSAETNALRSLFIHFYYKAIIL